MAETTNMSPDGKSKGQRVCGRTVTEERDGVFPQVGNKGGKLRRAREREYLNIRISETFNFVM